MRESSRCEVLDSLTSLWESFQVRRALSLSFDDCKPRPREESMEQIVDDKELAICMGKSTYIQAESTD